LLDNRCNFIVAKLGERKNDFFWLSVQIRCNWKNYTVHFLKEPPFSIARKIQCAASLLEKIVVVWGLAVTAVANAGEQSRKQEKME
jgi:hypothetical protein